MTSDFIDSAEALDTLCQKLAGSEFLAIDTEFMREKTYFPKLALIQIASTEMIACIDPLAVEDLSPLKKLFADQNITKVFHAAGQDLELFYHLFGELPAPLYDTQVCATLQGLGDQIGYASLVKEMLGIELDKSHSRTDWLQRPLSQKQVRYAEDDVRHLARLYPMQRQQLEEQGRLAWLDEEFALMTDPARYRPAPEMIWRKIKGINRLRPAQLAILRPLAAWREEEAIRRDMPRRHVLGDDVLLDLSRLKPKTSEELSKLRGVTPKLVQHTGTTLLKLVEEGRSTPKEQWPTLPKKQRLNANQESQAEALMTIVKLCAAEYKLSASSLAGRKELEAVVSGERDLPILQGWRLNHGGRQILEFIEGRSTLTMQGNKLILK